VVRAAGPEHNHIRQQAAPLHQNLHYQALLYCQLLLPLLLPAARSDIVLTDAGATSAAAGLQHSVLLVPAAAAAGAGVAG